MKNKIAVIGGGPSGVIAAGTAANKNNDVYLFEKNEKIGKKLFITGKGRCNITNASDIENLLDNVSVNKEFLYSAFYSFTNDDIIHLLNKYGVKTKVERGNRVFPESDKSSDVINGFIKYLEDMKVQVILNKSVRNVSLNEDGTFTLSFYDGDKQIFNKVIIATGGKSYPTTGSTGDGYIFAKHFGHTIVEPKPALVGCEVKENWIKELQGLSLKNVKLMAFLKDKMIFEEFGEMLFTHYGISGPIVLSMSNYINKAKNTKVSFKIDLKPSLDLDKVDSRLIRDFEKYSRKQFNNSLNELLPKKLIPIVVSLSGIDGDKMVNQITKEERVRLAYLLKNFPLHFKNLRPINEAIITSGGVSTLEINPSTMESKFVKGLFFCGEAIDVDAFTGGYNLQIAYSTGYLAGLNC